MTQDRLRRFRRLVEPELAALYRTAFRLAGNRPDAEDLVQETCLRAWEKLPKPANSGHVDRWLHRILMHCFIDGTRRKRRGPIQAIDGGDDPTPGLASPEPGPAELARRDEHAVALDRAWEGLEPTQKLLLSLRAEGFDLAEIEAITGISRDVLRARLHRARRRFARALEASGDLPAAQAQSGRKA
jgi:RNA polymerase sigma-70 factor (ECF subfamily)